MLASPLPPVRWPGAPLAAPAVTSLPSRAMQGKHRPSRQAPAPQNPHGRLFMGSSEHRLCRGPPAGPGPVAPASLPGGRGSPDRVRQIGARRLGAAPGRWQPRPRRARSRCRSPDRAQLLGPEPPRRAQVRAAGGSALSVCLSLCRLAPRRENLWGVQTGELTSCTGASSVSFSQRF